jgi:hypothetical protein
MTDPAGSDRIQKDDMPSPAGTGDDADSGASFEDVPLSREEAVERDSAHDDEQPARPGSDLGLLDRADPDGSA